MILEKFNLKDNLRLEIVNGDDIILSYKNTKYVDSCMSRGGRWKYTRLYKYVKNLKLLRIMKDDDLVLRSLIWNVEDKDKANFNLIDTVYYSKRVRERSSWDCCSNYINKTFFPNAYTQFKEVWSKYADVRRTAKQVFAKLLPNNVKIWPYMDTLTYYNPKRLLLSNDEEEGFHFYEHVDNLEFALDRGTNDYI